MFVFSKLNSRYVHSPICVKIWTCFRHAYLVYYHAWRPRDGNHISIPFPVPLPPASASWWPLELPGFCKEMTILCDPGIWILKIGVYRVYRKQDTVPWQLICLGNYLILEHYFHDISWSSAASIGNFFLKGNHKPRLSLESKGPTDFKNVSKRARAPTCTGPFWNQVCPIVYSPEQVMNLDLSLLMHPTWFSLNTLSPSRVSGEEKSPHTSSHPSLLTRGCRLCHLRACHGNVHHDLVEK